MASDNIEELKDQLEGKTLDELATKAGNNEENELDNISEELLDNRDYDKYDYYEIDMKKGSTKNHAIMFFLYIIVIALIVITIVFYQYKDQFKKDEYSKVDNYETQNKL